MQQILVIKPYNCFSTPKSKRKLRALEEECGNMEELETSQEELRRRELEYQDKIVRLEEELKKLNA